MRLGLAELRKSKTFLIFNLAIHRTVTIFSTTLCGAVKQRTFRNLAGKGSAGGREGRANDMVVGGTKGGQLSEQGQNRVYRTRFCGL